MNTYQTPWRWPISMGIAAFILWAVIFMVPFHWFSFLLNINQQRKSDSQAPESGWLVLLPPPDLLIDHDRENPKKIDPPGQEPEPFKPQDWWNKSESIAVVVKKPITGSRFSSRDSVSYFLNRLGLANDFMTRSQPDSVLAAKIFFLQLEDNFNFSDAKPYLNALGRAKDYEDIMSRAAAMYNEFLQTNIMVPD